MSAATLFIIIRVVTWICVIIIVCRAMAGGVVRRFNRRPYACQRSDISLYSAIIKPAYAALPCAAVSLMSVALRHHGAARSGTTRRAHPPRGKRSLLPLGGILASSHSSSSLLRARNALLAATTSWLATLISHIRAVPCGICCASPSYRRLP